MPHRCTASTVMPSGAGNAASAPNTASRSAPASSSDANAMSPAMPEKGWNQAMVVTPSRPPGPWVARPGHGARRTEAVVDADDRDARGARRQHGQQGGDAAEAGAVA